MLFDVHGSVGTPCGKDLHVKRGILPDLLMPVKIVDGIVGGAKEGDAALFDKSPCTHTGLGELFVAEFPYLLGIVFTQMSVKIEIPLKFEMAPVIEGITDRLSQTRCPFDELVVIGCLAGYVFFLDAAASHEAPFVVVASKPYLGDVVELSVLRDLFGRDMAVII